MLKIELKGCSIKKSITKYYFGKILFNPTRA